MPHWRKIPGPCLVPIPNYWTWTKPTTHHNKYGNNVFFASRYQRDMNATSICSCHHIKTLTSTQSYASTGWMLLSLGNSSYFCSCYIPPSVLSGESFQIIKYFFPKKTLKPINHNQISYLKICCIKFLLFLKINIFLFFLMHVFYLRIQ